MVVTLVDGKSVSKSVEGEGAVPTECPGCGAMAIAFQKQSKAGKLKVEIMKGDKVVAESETRLPMVW